MVCAYCQVTTAGQHEKHCPCYQPIRVDILRFEQLKVYAQPCYQSVIIDNFISNLLENIEDLKPQYSQLVDEHFWELANE